MGLATPWTRVKLGNIGQSLIGLTYSPNNVKRSGTLVLRSSNIQDGRLNFEDNVYVDCKIPDRIRVQEKDILICVRNGSRRLIGKSVMLDRRVVGQTFGAFMTVFRSDANPYLQYFFQSDDFKKQIDEHLGATINQITNGSLNSFIVDLPSRGEQQAIAGKLQDVDQVIASLERLITKKQAVKQGMMQELLTGRTRLPGFHQHWPSMALSEVAGYHRETVDPRRYPTRLFEHYSLPAFDSGQGPIKEHGSAIESIKFVLPPEAVMVSKLNPRIPRVWAPEKIGKNAVASTEFIVLTARAGVNRAFLYWLLKSDAVAERMKLLAVGTTGSHARIHPAYVRAIEVQVPGETEQHAIASILDDVSSELVILRARLDKIRAIKQGMMQELLTGRMRLPVSEAVA